MAAALCKDDIQPHLVRLRVDVNVVAREARQTDKCTSSIIYIYSNTNDSF